MKQLPLYSQHIVDAHLKCCRDIVKNRLDELERQLPCLAQRMFLRRIRKFIAEENGFVTEAVNLKKFVLEIEQEWYCHDDPLPKWILSLNSKLEKIFYYDGFAKRVGTSQRGGGIPLMKEILKHLKYCPYCNADMVYTLQLDEREPPYKSAFDHFFPRSRYPFLALSLYNLLPACERCNSKFKRDKYKEPLATFQPYLHDVDASTRFVLIGLTNEMRNRDSAKNTLSVHLLPKPGAPDKVQELLDNYQNLFHIDDVYSLLYNDQALRFFRMGTILNEAYLKEVEKRFAAAGMHVDAIKLLFDTPLRRSEIDRHHLAKLKLDILEQYCGIEVAP